MVAGQMVSDWLFDRYVRKKASLGQFKQSAEGDVYAMEPLRDMLFEVLPDWSRHRGWLPDALLVPLVVACFFVNILWRRDKLLRYQGWIVLRRFLFILTILYAFRTFTFIVTTVPSPLSDCLPMYVEKDGGDNQNGGDNNNLAEYHKYLVLFGRMASGKVTACTDNIYSGHTTLITVSVWCFWQYSGAWWFKAYALIHASLVLMSILICRLHYTVDIIVAVIIASFVYVTVHYLIQFAIDERYNSTNHIGDQNAIDDNLKREKQVLERINFKFISRAISWIDGMDLR